MTKGFFFLLVKIFDKSSPPSLNNEEQILHFAKNLDPPPYFHGQREAPARLLEN